MASARQRPGPLPGDRGTGAATLAMEWDTMTSRSWMAALGLATSAFLAGAGVTVRGGEEPVVNTVNLELRIAGLGQDGCEIEIKPAHPGCKFETVRRRVERGVIGGISKLPPIAIVAESSCPDRDCAFAITITEPEREARTFPRHLRLRPVVAGKPAPVLPWTCYLTTPSLAAKDAPDGRRRR